MTIPDYQSLMLPVLRFAAQGETKVPDIAERIADELGLTQAERDEILPSGRQRILHNRIHWAKFYMGKAGLIDSPSRGRFVASAEGRKLLASNPTSIDVETLKAYPAFVQFYEASRAETPSDLPISPSAPEASATPEEQIDAAQSVLHAALKADLLQRILAQSPTLSAPSSTSSSPWAMEAAMRTPPAGSASRAMAASTA